MYPAKAPSCFQSRAEERLYHLFSEQLPDDYTVMYSVNWVDPHSHEFHREGEADFVIIHEQLGIIVLEVKGGSIELREGQWYSIDREGNVHDLKRSPMLQARFSMRTILDQVKRAPLTKQFQAQYRFHTGVVFPNIPVGRNGLGPDTPRKVVIDRTDLHSLDAALRRIVSDQPPRVPLTRKAIEAFVELVRPNEILDDLGYADVILESGRRIEAVTERQNEVLHQLQVQHQIAIPGCAGSGKTLLALRKARFLAQNGLRVLLTCYNRPLGFWLQEQVKRDAKIPEGSVRVANFHRLVDDLLNESGIRPLRRQPGSSSSDHFNSKVPEYLFDHADQIKDRFDAVIVDEGQDFSPAMWTALQALMKNPDTDMFYVFFDAEQGIYQQGSDLPVRISDVALLRNLRNTHQIHQKLVRYYSGDTRPHSSEIDGLEPEVIPVPVGQRLRSMQRVFNRLLNDEGIPTDNVVVLTFAGKDNSELQEGDKLGKYYLTWKPEKRRDNQVQVSTVQSFKGLERAIVIIMVEIEHIPRFQHDSLIYVAMSRAKQHLVVIGELPEPQGTFTDASVRSADCIVRTALSNTAQEERSDDQTEPELESPERSSSVENTDSGDKLVGEDAAKTGTGHQGSTSPRARIRCDREEQSEPDEETVVDGDFRDLANGDTNSANEETSFDQSPEDPPRAAAIALPAPADAAVVRRNRSEIDVIAADGAVNAMLAASCYIFWFIAPLLVLATSSSGNRFTRTHAHQSLVFATMSTGFLVLFTVCTLVAIELLPLLMCVLWVGFVAPFLISINCAYQTYARHRAEFPVLSSITRALVKDR